jgi:ATP-binding cassette subfamily C protein
MSPAARRKAVVRLLTHSVGARRTQWIQLAAWSVVQAAPAFLSGRLIAYSIDQGFLAKDQLVGFAWLAALAASFILGAWGTRQTYRALAAIVEPFRDEITTMVVTGGLRRSTLPGAAPDTAAVARLTRQVEVVREAYGSVLYITQTFLVTTVGALVGLLTLIPVVLVFVLPPLALALGLFVAVLPRMAAWQRASILADERIAESVSTLAGGFRDIAASGGEEPIEATVGEHIDTQAQVTNRLAQFTAARTFAVAVGGLLPLVLILVDAGWLRRHGATTGAIVGALTYVLEGVQPPLQTLMRGLAGTGTWLMVALGRIVEATAEPPTRALVPVVNDRSSNGSRPAPASHDVRFGKITFRYGQSAAPIVRGLDFNVPDGAHLAIVGPSGIGKSTLANLVSGILEPEAGELRLGGFNVGALDVKARVRHRVLIPQEAYVFAGTVRENLAYHRDAVTSTELDEAVDVLGARELIDRLGGYDAYLDPSALSAGERQLITLVRAYVSPARLVILDEATCHLDPRSEARVEHAFAQRPCTLIVIAHRISSALRADRILLLDGRQAVLGTHEGLLAGSALYRDLVGHWEAGSSANAAAVSNSSLS